MRHFPRRIAPFRNWIGRSRQNGLGNHFGRIAFFHRFPHGYIHASARGVIGFQQLIRPGEILFE